MNLMTNDQSISYLNASSSLAAALICNAHDLYLMTSLQLDMSAARDAFEYLTVQLAGLLWRFSDGGFSMWAFTPPNVWYVLLFFFQLCRASWFQN